MISQDMLVDWLAVLLGLFNGNQEVKYVKAVVMVNFTPKNLKLPSWWAPDDGG